MDITHFKALSHEEVLAIENKANAIINSGTNIKKSFMDKAVAEKEHGFHLYQGGIVPGNTLRVVDIEGIDTEACCGTHCDNTSEVGWVKIVKSGRISDGVVRLNYKVRERAMEELNKETTLIHDLTKLWKIDQDQVIPTGQRFFNEYKRQTTLISKMEIQVLNLQVKCILSSGDSIGYVHSDHPNATLYFSFLASFAEDLKKAGKGVIFCGDNFVNGLIGEPKDFNLDELKEYLNEGQENLQCRQANKVAFKNKEVKKAKAVTTKDILSFSFQGKDFNKERFDKYFETKNIANFS